jgi:dipeptidyl aminopeptidase/acylaminoacyl peptidase
MPRQITRGEFAEEQPAWSADGASIYFRSRRYEDDFKDDVDLWAVPAGGGEMRSLVKLRGALDSFSVSPDGRRLAFVATPEIEPARSYDQPDLLVADTAGGGTPRNLTAEYDFDIAAPLTGDQKNPRGDRPQVPLWTGDGRSLLVSSAERGRSNLQRVDAATGKLEPLTTGNQEVVSYTASRDGARVALVLSTPTVINDLYVLETATGKMRALVKPNEELFAEIALSAPEEITYASFDGRPIQAWVQKPVDFDPAKKYPLILNIHGGPHAAYGWTFDHEFQWMAAKGYVVLYPNPRGSSAYGQEFGNVIQFKFPGDDAKDLLAGVDELLRRGYVDPRRLGVTGGSGGGILTNWILTQTDRFAAAVSQRSISDWAAFWYTSDIILFRPFWFRGAPWEDPEDFAARSPITHVAKIKTPLMLIEGEADRRTPSGAGGEPLFRALRYLKRPVVMVRFPGETHELSRSGAPWHRVERLQHMVAWFDKYLLGKGGEQYDVD